MGQKVRLRATLTVEYEADIEKYNVDSAEQAAALDQGTFQEYGPEEVAAICQGSDVKHEIKVEVAQ